MSIRDGLPYGWWKSGDFWATVTFLFILCPLAVLLLAAWFLDLKAWW